MLINLPNIECNQKLWLIVSQKRNYDRIEELSYRSNAVVNKVFMFEISRFDKQKMGERIDFTEVKTISTLKHSFDTHSIANVISIWQVEVKFLYTNTNTHTCTVVLCIIFIVIAITSPSCDYKPAHFRHSFTYPRQRSLLSIRKSNTDTSAQSKVLVPNGIMVLLYVMCVLIS